MEPDSASALESSSEQQQQQQQEQVGGVPATIRMSASMNNISIEKSYQDLEGWLTKLGQGMPLSEVEVKLLCDLARETLLQESNVQPVSAPVTVCGDIHGTLNCAVMLLCVMLNCAVMCYVVEYGQR